MRGLACICCVAVLIGCAGDTDEADPAAGDTAAMAPTTPAMPAAGTISLADVAGTWNVRGMPEGSDSAFTYQLIADADSTWGIKFTDRPDTVRVQVLTVAGDSIVTQAGPYPSTLRRGVQVTTRSVFRLQGGQLIGATVARYTTTGPDSVLNIRSEGTRGQ
jgi:hypothetical protein